VNSGSSRPGGRVVNQKAAISDYELGIRKAGNQEINNRSPWTRVPPGREAGWWIRKQQSEIRTQNAISTARSPRRPRDHGDRREKEFWNRRSQRKESDEWRV